MRPKEQNATRGCSECGQFHKPSSYCVATAQAMRAIRAPLDQLGLRKETPSGFKRGQPSQMLGLIGSSLWPRVRTLTNAIGDLSHNCSPARQGCGWLAEGSVQFGGC